ncbi:hypothetical protein [Nocardia sp.]|nr:hypothetical protein [Nocardia sp.]
MKQQYSVLRPTGTHSWGYWQEDLHRSRNRRPPQRRRAYRSALCAMVIG